MQEAPLARETIEIDRQRVSRELGVQPCTRATKEMQFIAKDRLFRGDHVARGCAVRWRFPRCARVAQPADGVHEIAPPTVEVAALVNGGKEIPLRVPLAHQLGFDVPATTRAHNCHADQFTITVLGCASRAREQGREVLPHLINHDVHPQTNIIRLSYLRPPA